LARFELAWREDQQSGDPRSPGSTAGSPLYFCLRKEFPEEFENPVDASLVPTDWVHLRIVVKGAAVQVYAGKVQSPTLEVRKLGSTDRGAVGLWVGNNSDGDFADVRVTGK